MLRLLLDLVGDRELDLVLCSILASITLSSRSAAASGSRKTRTPCSSITSSSSAGSATTLSCRFVCVPDRLVSGR
jgi:hypothetical protein